MTLAALARRAGSEPEDPWLFYRRAWDWKWRSWGQVADQAARGAATLRRSPALAGPAGVRIAFDGRQDPDAVAAGLAVQAAGATAVPRAVGPLRPLEVTLLADGEPSVRLRIPACSSRLERWEPRPLEPGNPGELAFDPAAPGGSDEEIEHQVEGLTAILPPAAAGRRPIVCASAGLDSRATQILQAWTVIRGAAWVLEPDREDFPGAVLWSRPTLVVAGSRELGLLAAALGCSKKRRHHRLAAVVAVGGAGSEGWEELGVPVVEWSP